MKTHTGLDHRDPVRSNQDGSNGDDDEVDESGREEGGDDGRAALDHDGTTERRGIVPGQELLEVELLPSVYMDDAPISMCSLEG